MLSEVTFADLYQNIVDAFPFTTKRQHATQTIRIVEMNWTPFIGMRTLMIRSRANNFAGGGKEYKTIAVFKNVLYQQGPGDGIVEFVANDGLHYYVNPISKSQNDVLVRCQCKDLFWRFQHEDFTTKCLQGSDRKPYQPISNRGPVNPTHVPGCCKHLIRTMEALQDAGIIIN